MQETLLKQATLGLGDVATSEYWKTLQLSGADSLRDFASATPEKIDPPDVRDRETQPLMPRANAIAFLEQLEEYRATYVTTFDSSRPNETFEEGCERICGGKLRLPPDLVERFVAIIGDCYNFFTKTDPSYVAALLGNVGRRLVEDQGNARIFTLYTSFFHMVPFGDVDLCDERLITAECCADEIYGVDVYHKALVLDRERAKKSFMKIWDKAKSYRCDLAETLRYGLSREDVPLLEELFQCKARGVQRAVSQLLATFPETEHAKKYCALADELLTEEGLASPEQIKRVKKKLYSGQEYDWFWNLREDEALTTLSTLGVVPLAHWEERFHTTPKELDARFPFNFTNAPVFLAWIFSFLRFGGSIDWLKVVCASLVKIGASYDLTKPFDKEKLDADARVAYHEETPFEEFWRKTLGGEAPDKKNYLKYFVVMIAHCFLKEFGSFDHFKKRFETLFAETTGQELTFNLQQIADWLAANP